MEAASPRSRRARSSGWPSARSSRSRAATCCWSWSSKRPTKTVAPRPAAGSGQARRGGHNAAVTRIVAGAAGGRRLAVPPSGTRPTSDRVREALFSALGARPGLDGAAVLDLCAGSGALGLEALSRGAAHVLLVESDRRAAAVLRRNVAAVDLPGAQVRAAPGRGRPRGPGRPGLRPAARRPALRHPGRRGGRRGSPPRIAHGWLADDATVVVERPTRAAPFPWPAPLQPFRERRYGETTLHLGALLRSQP